jgi:acetoin utilization protein AcuC
VTSTGSASGTRPGKGPAAPPDLDAAGAVTVLWDDALLDYDLGDHPLHPVRVELTVALARRLGVLDRAPVTVEAPAPASDGTLTTVHEPAYLAAVKAAPDDPFFRGYGLNTGDNPVFDRMHEASALVCGASVAAAEAVWTGRSRRAVNIAGGLHHAMPDRAHGFCVYNDPAVAIRRLLDLGAERIAYVDVDVHHGDGVQTFFWDDPRVLTVSIHETPLALFPGVTGFAAEVGGPNAEGTAVNVALPPGTGDAGWLRAYHAVVPSVVRAFDPQLLVTQCGCDTHALDPLADLRLTVDGQRAGYLALRDLAEQAAGGRWVALGGGGYGLTETVPRAWTHLLAVLTGEPLDPLTALPDEWRALARERCPRRTIPRRMTDDGDADGWTPWQPDGGELVDRAVRDTRRAVFPLHGLDPDDPRD